MSKSEGLDQKKVFLWCSPRTTSTVFLKCMTSIPNTIGFNELYNLTWLVEKIHDKDDETAAPHVAALRNGIRLGIRHYLGNMITQMKQWHTVDQHDKVYSRAYCRGLLEADYPNAKMMFVKDMASSIHEQYHFIPSNYRHTFLIRDPVKAFHSYKKAFEQDTFKGIDFDIRDHSLFPRFYGYKELYDLWKWVKENADPNPVIIDSDDLVEDPGTILMKYCNSLQIPYSDDILNWDASDTVCRNWKGMSANFAPDNLFEKAIKSSRFEKSSGNTVQLSDLSQDLVECVEYSMPFYKEMYESRLTLD